MSPKRRVIVSSLDYDLSEDDESNIDPSDVDSEVFSSVRSSRRESTTSGKETRDRRGTRARSSTKRPCLNRNALLARVNRRRKKEYMENIENKLSHYKRENENLSSTIQRQGIDLKRLQGEVSYLRSVINNNSSITNLLRSMNETLSTGRSRNGPANGRNELSLRDPNFADDESVSSPRDRRSERLTRRDGGGKRSESDHTYTTTGRSVFDDTLTGYPNDDEAYARKNLLAARDSLSFDIDGSLERFTQYDDKLFDSLDDTFNCDPRSFGELETDRSTKLFDNLENSGVCLHVNSGRISLEFCSICHLNSVNASE